MKSVTLPEPLLARRRDFLDFLRRRAGDAEAAEDILQSAYAKAAEKSEAIRDEESSVAWFYRLLRNALIDRARKIGVEQRALSAQEPEAVADPQLRDAVCQCLSGAVETLKPGYARLLQSVDLDGAAVPDAARLEGITANNAHVRLHRARAALRETLRQMCGACARHGCLDCGCKRAV